MKLSTSLVAVRKINSAIPRSNFSQEELDCGAQVILAAQGVINPIILRRTNLDSYEVVDGNFEYYAAVRAREINPRKGEMIGAFIIEDENEEAIKKQIQLFRKPKLAVSKPKISGLDNNSIRLTTIESQMATLNSQLTHLEARLENQIGEVKIEQRRDIQILDARLKAIESRLLKPIEPLEALNNLTLPELTSSLEPNGVNVKVIEKIVRERDKNGKFNSCGEVISRVKGLGEKTMMKILDCFSG
ncbi:MULTISPECIES: helix-hairpin-helix domain-containing protein [unclassified Coleofasciculus]|uniref:ParB N-terminal domain-containing protein n=1 Tax=unclassified Coleofasciculus TaxID=2692782 RepID=UPI00187E51DF|nr:MULTISPECIES: helix-hairpin-helix domain-containing protein [unclassified Coleofasciculus]MBE9126883.1 helix-hairpin-helix domain-containing protein [Coleofasciculus sp. LEGE 07081]MBE9150248.1 helix-hairpin-helix domain-containing protein [Coleofasciculus sp. LEGE 07092]